jgi:hypothetical protein
VYIKSQEKLKDKRSDEVKQKSPEETELLLWMG